VLQKINEKINSYKVVMIDENGKNVGEVEKFKALTYARNLGLDLVEVKPGKIPTCKIMDYGRFCYNKNKNQKHNSHHHQTTKEMWFKANIEKHDIDIKVKKIKEFIDKGYKVVVGMKLNGREREIQGINERFYLILSLFVENLDRKSVVNSGNSFTYTIVPGKT
jgi:translation initiation factor IF-3